MIIELLYKGEVIRTFHCSLVKDMSQIGLAVIIESSMEGSYEKEIKQPEVNRIPKVPKEPNRTSKFRPKWLTYSENTSTESIESTEAA